MKDFSGLLLRTYRQVFGVDCATPGLKNDDSLTITKHSPKFFVERSSINSHFAPMKGLLTFMIFLAFLISGKAQTSDKDTLKPDNRPMKGKTFYLGRNGNIVTPKDYELKFSNSSMAGVDLKLIFSVIRTKIPDKCFNVYLNQEKDFGTVTFRTASNIDMTEVNEWIKHLDAEVIEIKVTDVE